MIWRHPNPVAHVWLGRNGAQIDETVLLTEGVEGSVVQLSDNSITLEAKQITCECFRTGVDHPAIAGRRADDGCKHRKGAIAPIAGARRDKRSVAINVGPGTVLGGGRQSLIAPHVGGPSGRDDRRRDSFSPEDFA